MAESATIRGGGMEPREALVGDELEVLVEHAVDDQEWDGAVTDDSTSV